MDPCIQSLPNFLFDHTRVKSRVKSNPDGRFRRFLGLLPNSCPHCRLCRHDLLEKSVKTPEKKVIAGMNPMRYRGKPRLGTVVERLRVTDYVSDELGDMRIPFIVLHGSADVVTDPDVSRELFTEQQGQDYYDAFAFVWRDG